MCMFLTWTDNCFLNIKLILFRTNFYNLHNLLLVLQVVVISSRDSDHIFNITNETDDPIACFVPQTSWYKWMRIRQLFNDDRFRSHLL